jgi:hypothetical protein
VSLVAVCSLCSQPTSSATMLGSKMSTLRLSSSASTAAAPLYSFVEVSFYICGHGDDCLHRYILGGPEYVNWDPDTWSEPTGPYPHYMRGEGKEPSMDTSVPPQRGFLDRSKIILTTRGRSIADSLDFRLEAQRLTNLELRYNGRIMRNHRQLEGS